MKRAFACVILFILSLVGCLLLPVSADYLLPDDFNEESWSKTIDYLEYVDVYAATHGLPRPPAGARANLFMTYVNHLGTQMLYAGLTNITMALGKLTCTIPIQTFMMHYKAENQSQDTIIASSYVMLLAYNETADTTVHPDSPDRNDTLYASFNMGFDLSSLIDTTDRPGLNSNTIVTPLTHSEDKLTWHWGMTYTNLTSIWWRVYIHPNNSSYKSIPVAFSIYEKLTFTYDLTFNPDDNTATITSNYVIGRITDLWVVDTWWWFIPIVVHYNGTGCYRLNKSLYSEETVHQFLRRLGISTSMVLFQASAILDHTTESSVNGQNVTDNEILVSNDTISTFMDDGTKVFDVDFGSKSQYTLHNYTSTTSADYNAVTRTAERKGFAKNPIFHIHTFLMRYIPLALAHMDEDLFEQAKNQLLNMTYADYFYIIAYPTYEGYEIEHDPTYIAYSGIVEEPAPGPSTGFPSLIPGLVLVAVIALIVAIPAALILKRRSRLEPPSVRR